MKKRSNKKNAYAIWLDHKSAIVVCVDGEGNTITEPIKSGIFARRRFSGEETDKTGMLGKTLDQQKRKQNKEHEMIKHFMKNIVAKISHPSIIMIMGPADAKYDLHRQLDSSKSLKPEWVEIKTMKKMKASEIRSALAMRLRKGIHK